MLGSFSYDDALDDPVAQPAVKKKPAAPPAAPLPTHLNNSFSQMGSSLAPGAPPQSAPFMPPRNGGINPAANAPVGMPSYASMPSSLGADPPGGRGVMGAGRQAPQEIPSYTDPTTGARVPGRNPGTMQQPGQPQTQPDRETATAVFTSSLDQLAKASSPADRAVAQDRLSREVFSSLSSSGHDVKWQGDTLMVDGRPYKVGGQATAGPGQQGHQEFSRSGVMPGDDPIARSGVMPGDDNISYLGGSADFDESSGTYKSTGTGDKFHMPKTGHNGWQGDFVPTEMAKDWVRNFVRQNAGGKELSDTDPAWGWIIQQAQQLGVDVNKGLTRHQWNGLVDRMREGLPHWQPSHGPGPGPGGPPLPGGPPGQEGWHVTAPGYTPGTMDMSDLDGFSLDELLGQLGGEVTPEALPDNYSYGDLSGLGASATDQMVDSRVRNLLTNPHGLDDRTIDMLKARSKDEIAEMSKMEDDELKAMGLAAGIDDSNWLASERASARRGRQGQIVQSNRAIDLEAAATRKADERAALQLGSGVADTARGRRASETALGEEIKGSAFDRNQAARQQNIDNLFKSREQKQASVALASDTALKAAAQKGDRMALQEGWKQKATELGLETDKVALQHVLGQMADLTERYGLDLANAIDLKKLEQGDSQFKASIAFQFEELARRVEMFYSQEARLERQFGAEFGLRAAGMGGTGTKPVFPGAPHPDPNLPPYPPG